MSYKMCYKNWFKLCVNEKMLPVTPITKGGCSHHAITLQSPYNDP